MAYSVKLHVHANLLFNDYETDNEVVLIILVNE